MSKPQLVRNSTLLFRNTTENVYVSPNLRQIQQTLLFVLKEDSASILHNLTEGPGNKSLPYHRKQGSQTF